VIDAAAAAAPDPEPRIRVLPPELADQIAAGEVVERPASVVKELAENAIDAGATRIEIEVEAGGRRLIRVVDDGCGMSPDEARLALRRHATSKIAQAEDLWGLPTFGFRGEALPSIAAVARLTVATKVRGRLAGFRLTVEAGRETDAREAGLPDGTQLEVRDLFFNTPARLKFLKTEQTEAANVSEAVLRLALGHPEVHFKLRLNDRVALDLPPHRTLAERVRAALARRGAGVLHEALGAENGVRVQAFVAAPEEASATPRNTFLFVGRRFVRDRSLLAALGMAYGELLEKGRYPLAALFVDVPGEEVDINVHPQKLEVRFARAQEVYGAVRHVVGAAIAKAPWLQAGAPAPGRPFSLPVDRAGRGGGGGRVAPLPGVRPPPADPGPAPWDQDLWRPPGPGRAGDASNPPVPTGLAGAAPLEVTPPSAGAAPTPGAPESLIDPAAAAPVAETAEEGGAPAETGFFASLLYIGQLHRTYLLCEADGELVLIDQHAAHERVAFERIRAAHRDRAVARQRLLFPIPIELDDTAAAVAAGEEARAALEALGFDIEPFGERTVLLRAVPEVCKATDPKPLLLSVLETLAAGDPLGPRHGPGPALERIYATMACHSVVRAGDRLSPEQVRALFAQLDRVDVRSHCPHGRPVLVRLGLAELERRFGRS
jgi:DNA mismatch repair protein MutL